MTVNFCDDLAAGVEYDEEEISHRSSPCGVWRQSVIHQPPLANQKKDKSQQQGSSETKVIPDTKFGG